MREAQQVLGHLAPWQSQDSKPAGLQVFVHTFVEFQQVHDECSLPKLNGNSGAHYLWVHQVSGRVQAHLFAPDTDGVFYALKTLQQLMLEKKASIMEAEVFDQPVGKMRGVLEGFYGKVWSKEGRLAMMRELANLKFNFYLYSPKDDGYINLAWPTPYPMAELNYIKDLIAEATRQHMQVCWQIHCLWPVAFRNDADIQTIADKMSQVVERGADCLLIGFDDLEKVLSTKDAEVYTRYTEGQIDWLQRFGAEIQKRHPGIRLVLTPHEYYNNHPEFQTDFKEISASLQPYWEYGWTGPEIGSGKVTEADVAKFEEVAGELPILGDNYPVNDMMVLMYGEHYIHLGPVQGRDPSLPSTLPAIAFNAATDMYGSLPALATIADYLWNPAAYVPQASSANSSLFYAGFTAGPALQLMASMCNSDMISPSVAPALQAQIGELWTAWDSKDSVAFQTEKGTLSQTFMRMKEVPDLLVAGALHPGILLNLKGHIERFGEYGSVGLTALMALGKKLEGTSLPSSIADQIAELHGKTGLEMAPHPTGEIMPEFLARVVVELGK